MGKGKGSPSRVFLVLRMRGARSAILAERAVGEGLRTSARPPILRGSLPALL